MGLPPYGPEPYASANSATPANAEFNIAFDVPMRKNFFENCCQLLE